MLARRARVCVSLWTYCLALGKIHLDQFVSTFLKVQTTKKEGKKNVMIIDCQLVYFCVSIFFNVSATPQT